MNLVVASITLRQLLSRRRTLLLVLLGALLLVVALIRRLSGTSDASDTTFTADLLDHLGIAVVMPLVVLLFGTGAMGAELEEGTAIYLLAKPVSRFSIALTKYVVALGCSLLLSCVPILLAALLSGGQDVTGVALGFTVAAAIGAAVYCTIFLALSLVTGRAFVFGLAYVLVWESFLAGLLPGVRTLSVREQTLAFAKAIGDIPDAVFKANLAAGTAAVAAILIALVAMAIAARRLRRIEITGETA
jgi:ABC-2 type transport system permease protein